MTKKNFYIHVCWSPGDAEISLNLPANFHVLLIFIFIYFCGRICNICKNFAPKGCQKVKMSLWLHNRSSLSQPTWKKKYSFAHVTDCHCDFSDTSPHPRLPCLLVTIFTLCTSLKIQLLYCFFIYFAFPNICFGDDYLHRKGIVLGDTT